MTPARIGMKLSAVLLGLGMSISSTDAAPGFAIRGSVIANGGPSSTPATNGSRSVQGTLGQAVVGSSSGAGKMVCSGFWCFGGSRVVAIDPHSGQAALQFGPAVPNPTRGTAAFRLLLPEASDVSLTVYDIAGRQMGEPVARRLEAGEQALNWQAPSGQSGIYFVRLTTDDVVRARRTVVVVR